MGGPEGFEYYEDYPFPDYFNDLNAMNKAEEVAMSQLMDADQWASYAKTLESIHPTASIRWAFMYGMDDRYYEIANLLHSAAAQRAEAFGITLGLWEK